MLVFLVNILAIGYKLVYSQTLSIIFVSNMYNHLVVHKGEGFKSLWI